ncbi:MAG: hypothetical protein OXC96_10800 [Cyanobacteria bacterium MAG CAR1_bin_15]|nr:hypothetical protein [Cyanobacteria bacterium MAG CAR1_bin_15]
MLLRKLLVLPLILLAACGSGGDSTSQASPSRPSRSNSNSCFRAQGGDCLTNTELAAKAQQLVTALKSAIAQDSDNSFSQPSARNAGKWPLEMVNHYGALAPMATASWTWARHPLPEWGLVTVRGGGASRRWRRWGR